MKIVKINSLGCPSCIIMNKIINELKSEYKNVVFEDYDYDFDDIEKFNVGKILPVFIFYDGDREITRLCGEHKKEEFIKILEGELWKE